MDNNISLAACEATYEATYRAKLCLTIQLNYATIPCSPNGGMVDANDLKSFERKLVPVRVRLWAAFFTKLA